MTGNKSERNYPHEKDGKSIFWYYDNIDDEITLEACSFLPFSTGLLLTYYCTTFLVFLSCS
jgi:hypothetical protein